LFVANNCCWDTHRETQTHTHTQRERERVLELAYLPFVLFSCDSDKGRCSLINNEEIKDLYQQFVTTVLSNELNYYALNFHVLVYELLSWIAVWFIFI